MYVGAMVWFRNHIYKYNSQSKRQWRAPLILLKSKVVNIFSKIISACTYVHMKYVSLLINPKYAFFLLHANLTPLWHLYVCTYEVCKYILISVRPDAVIYTSRQCILSLLAIFTPHIKLPSNSHNRYTRKDSAQTKCRKLKGQVILIRS